jgi:MoxR-like ATPase
MMKLIVSHNSHDEELAIMRRVANKTFEIINAILNITEIQALQDQVQKIHIDEELESYIVQLIVATRETQQEDILFGVSPRASIDLYKASKARAFLRGNDFVSPADIAYVIHNILRHRIVLSYEARAKGLTSDSIISHIVETLPIP